MHNRVGFWIRRSALVVGGLLMVATSAAWNAIGPRAQERSQRPTQFQQAQAPNSRVALTLPTTFRPAKLYSGFEDEGRGISYLIFEAPPAAYDEMKVAFTPDKLASRGLTDGKVGQLARTGDYVYMQARQTSPAGKYAKFFVLFRTEDQTVLVSANVPEKELDSEGAAVAEIEQEAGRIAGTSKLFTLDGQLEPEHKGATRSALIVAPSIDKRPIVDVNLTAKTLMQTISGYRDIDAGVPEPVTISGLDGVTLKGTGIDTQSGVRFVIYQVLLVSDDGGYYRLVGLVPEAEAEKLLPEIVRAALSFEVMPG